MTPYYSLASLSLPIIFLHSSLFVVTLSINQSFIRPINMQRFQILSILFLSLQSSAAAFQSSNSHVKKNSATVLHSASTGDASTSRRSFLDLMALAPLVVIPSAANASGGATAGGAYLLSAKQRYNERVKASVQGLLAVGDGLAGGSTTEAKAFFGSDDGGSWKDLTAAGYLLSNAFRRNSSSAPDSLPAVKVRKKLCLIFLIKAFGGNGILNIEHSRPFFV